MLTAPRWEGARVGRPGAAEAAIALRVSLDDAAVFPGRATPPHRAPRSPREFGSVSGSAQPTLLLAKPSLWYHRCAALEGLFRSRQLVVWNVAIVVW
ncbi:uncharacterized protein SOCE26_057970 [Sorangium cellulosum]|uniref:Uncharacterized protein n=1 Tax=Sorangium cellulosum TaxID=56 RepID=A0A2L0EYG5_SORCE|nr:uncharacterized protein SOCE26_057970 [Sorangium cellulosum]